MKLFLKESPLNLGALVEGEAPMLDAPNVMKMAQNFARYSGARQAEIAKNIAHADVPGYRARDLVDFSDIVNTSSAMRSSREKHFSVETTHGPLRSFEIAGEIDPNGNSVSVEAEMVRGTDAKSQHDMALSIYRASLDILRTAIGRG